MPRFVALFRGINVGKAKRIAMADLRALLESLGYSDVRTLLNSGNVVFSGRAAAMTTSAQRIRAAVAGELGVDALVIVKSAADISAAVAENPLVEVATDPSRLMVALTGERSGLDALKAWASTDWGADRLHVGTHAAYLWCGDGILESKAAVALLKLLAESGTTRNWATILKLQDMLDDRAR